MFRLTREHQNYNKPSEEYISDKLDFLGYEDYFPEKLFGELLNFCAHYMFERDANKALLNPHEFVGDMVFVWKAYHFFSSLQFEFYFSNQTPVEMAVHILKDLSEKIDFRKFECEEDDFQSELVIGGNDKFIISEEDKVYFDAMGTVITPENIKKILAYSAVLSSNLPIKGEDNVVTKRKRLNQVKDFLTSNKSEWVRPLFNYKVLTKSLPVRIKDYVSEEEDVIVLLEDASSSMGSNLGYLITKTVQRLLLEDTRILHYYRYAGTDIEFYELKTLNDKINCFKEEKPFYRANCDYRHLFKEVLYKYTRGDLVIITDGQDNVPAINTSLRIHCIECSGSSNIDMKQLCKSTNGKHILI